MANPMYDHSVPVFTRMLTNALQWLDKAEAHAQARKFDTANYLNMRLAPDMLPFARQIQIASDGAKGCVARLTGQDVPKWDDTEVSLADLRGRIARTLDYVQSVPESAYAGAAAREIVLPRPQGEPLRMTAENYLRHYVLPNLYFHLGMMYALLRDAGVEVGKRDWLGAFQ